MIRFEFIELLVRIAKSKYYDSGLKETLGEAFEYLLEANVYPLGLQIEW